LAVEPIAESIVQQEDGSIVDTVGEHVIPPAPEVEVIEDCHLDYPPTSPIILLNPCGI
jgi:hypothetical protein